MLDGGDGDGLEEVGVEVGGLRLLLGDLSHRLPLGDLPLLRLGRRWGLGLLGGCLSHVLALPWFGGYWLLVLGR